jgi:predicted nucleic acid-binding Zn ribbon protein
MPIYAYETITKDGSPGEVFEVMQKIGDAPLEKHPETGEPVRRRISTPNVTLQYTERATNNLLKDNKKLESLGFTKYERSGKGVMERKAGTAGPKVISAD